MDFNYDGKSLCGGIYKLTNRQNGRIYIGSAKRFKERWKSHERSLNLGKHANCFLQNDFNKCGTGVFVFEILAIVDGDKLARTAKEKEFLDEQINAGNWNNCYNIQKESISCDGAGFSLTPEETRQKRSKISKALWKDPVFRSKQIERLNTAEYKEKMSILSLERWNKLSCEEKRAIRDNLSAKLKGKTRTEEQRRRISEAHKGIKQTKELVEKRTIAVSNSPKMTRNYTLVSPLGETIVERNLATMARKYELNACLLTRLSKNDKVEQHKLWSLGGIKVYVFKNLENELHATASMANMAKLFNLNLRGLSKLINGRIKRHKNWTFVGTYNNTELFNKKDERYEAYKRTL